MSGSLRNQIQMLYLVGLFLLYSTELRGKQMNFCPLWFSGTQEIYTKYTTLKGLVYFERI